MKRTNIHDVAEVIKSKTTDLQDKILRVITELRKYSRAKNTNELNEIIDYLHDILYEASGLEP